jgi:hypothetical protein
VTRPAIGANSVAQGGSRLLHRVPRRLDQGFVHLDRRLELLELLGADQLCVGLLHREHALVALLRLDQVRARLGVLRLRRGHRGLRA